LEIPQIHVSSRRKSEIPTCLLQDCLKDYVKPEKITDYYCEGCKTKTSVRKHLSIHRLPLVLCLVLKRFAWTTSLRGKIDTFVKYPLEDLDMSPYSSPSPNSQLYNLQSIVYHHGAGVRVGHYTTSCLNEEKGEWIHFNDSKVTPLSHQELRDQQTPYIFFYQKKRT